MTGLLRQKVLSLFVIFAMVITLLPAGLFDQAQAASEYFRFTNFSTSQSDPTQVNRSQVDIVGSFNSVASDSISFMIEQLVNGQVVNSTSGSDAKPFIENNNMFRFLNVQLYQGLNRITVFGQNTSGNRVQSQAFVNFANVPVIYDVKLYDGRALEAGVPLVVDTQKPVILLKAPNADRVFVNGTEAFKSGNENFIVTEHTLTPGLNPLSIVAMNQTNKYTLNRDIVYFAGVPTPYDVKVTGGTPANVALEGNPTVGANRTDLSPPRLSGPVTGKLVFPVVSPAPAAPIITLEVRDGVTDALLQTLNTTVDPPSSTSTLTTFDFTSVTPIDIPSNGSYKLWVKSTPYGLQSASFPLPFSYRNQDTAYFTDVNQLYDVTVTGGVVTYQASSVFAPNSMFFELPIWMEAKLKNFTAGMLPDVSMTSSLPGLVTEKYLTSDGNVAFKIVNMTAGEQTLTLSVNSTGGTENRTVRLNYVPAPFFQLDNIYDGKIFTANDTTGTSSDAKFFSTIKGRLVNFNNTSGSPDHATVNVKINGKTVPLTSSLSAPIGSKGEFTFLPHPQSMGLVDGPNTIEFTGIANGIPVSTTLTVYMFSDQVPSITSTRPVPYDPTRLMDDKDLKFKPDGKQSYVTNEKSADVLFTVKNAEQVIVSVDGIQKYLVGDGTGFNLTSPYPDLVIEPYSDPITNTYTFRLINHKLPTTGTQNIVVQAVLDSNIASQTLTITRELSPYVLLSPKLPNERVINQNFLNVSIQAEGADQVLLGKEVMRKGEGDIFRFEVTNLKAGVNKFKFSVVRGTQKIDGEFEVNYAASPTIGAHFKTPMPKTGALTVFGGQIKLQFPQNTFLRKANMLPGQDYRQVDLFDSQQILFGIADRTDGRTVKYYNRVGEYETSIPRDGELRDIGEDEFAKAMLAPRPHFALASQLFWIDAGYFSGSGTNWTTEQAKHPYENTNKFYLRAKDKWMEPSQRGTITLKYDPYIVNAIAKKLSIWRYVPERGWVNTGGVVNTTTKEVTSSFDGFGYYAVMEDAYSFADVIGHGYARDALELMFAKGFMDPENVNNFGVYRNITRGEFATMLVKVLDIPINYDPANPTFQDVPPFEQYPALNGDYRYIETAVKRGIIRGLGPRVFAPADNLTREQAAVMIARAMNLVAPGADTDKDLASLQKTFTDANTVDRYAISGVLAVSQKGIILGRPNALTGTNAKPTFRYDPRAFLTRAEASVMSERIMRLLKRW